MARAGSFGRRPRASTGNLSSIIASLRRAQQSSEWQALQDAWKQGGQVDEGMFDPSKKGNKIPVTDAVLLKYMGMRRDELSTDDPDRAQWANAYTQTEFNVGESKMGLQFKQGSISAKDMANWYTSQLGKFPVESEMYRTVAGRAADWAKSAADAAKGSAQAAVTKALNARLHNNDITETAFNAMSAVVMAEAVRRGVASQQGDMTTIIDPAGFQRMLQSGVQGPNGQIIMESDWTTGIQRTYLAYNDDAAAYRQAGPEHANNVQTKLNEQAKFTAGYVLPTNALDLNTKHQVARDQWGKALESAQGNPYAMEAANEAYATAVETILGQAKRASNDPLQGEVPPGMIAGLENDVDLARTGTAKGVSWEDMQNGGASDTNETREGIQKIASDKALLESGRGIYGQAAPGAPYEVLDLSQEKGVTINDQGGITLSDNFQVTHMTLNGVDAEVWLQGRPEYATVLIDNTTGKVVEPAELAKLSDTEKASARYSVAVGDAAKPIGYTFYNGDRQAVAWAVRSADGALAFTQSNPFSGGLDTAPGYNLVGGKGEINEKGSFVSTPLFDPTQGYQPVAIPGTPVTPDALPTSAELNLSKTTPGGVSVGQVVPGSQQFYEQGGAGYGAGGLPVSHGGGGEWTPQRELNYAQGGVAPTPPVRPVTSGTMAASLLSPPKIASTEAPAIQTPTISVPALPTVAPPSQTISLPHGPTTPGGSSLEGITPGSQQWYEQGGR